jgi:hypothetical protein
MTGGHMNNTRLKGRFDMKPTRTHLVGVAAALSTIAIAAPVSTAAAATAPPAGAPAVVVSAGYNGSPAVAGQPATVVGPKFVTVGTATFTNMKIVVASGNATSEG